MSSEYHKWLARNEKPAEKVELTDKEKRANWWYYHKVHVIVGALAVLLVAWIVYDTWIDTPAQPDLQIAYVGTVSLPQETVEALETALGTLTGDLNGDGQVLVRVNEYVLDPESEDYMTQIASQTKLAADISECDSFIYLMEDPVYVQQGYAPLAYPDGSVPGEEDSLSEALWLSCGDCPVLMGLLEETQQTALSELYVARRIVDSSDKCPNLAQWELVWEQLIAPAA